MRTRHSYLLAALLLVVAFVYSDTLHNAFHFDDFHTITDNPAVRSLSNVPRFFTDATTFSVLPANRTYRPIVSTSLALDYALGRGYKLPWFHLEVLFFFLLLVALLAALYQRLYDATVPSPANAWLALGTAAWFGLHPAMAETVNYMIQRGDLYCTLGCVAALWLFIARPAWRRYGLYLLPFAVAMLSKPPAAIFPVLLLCYVLLFERGESVGRSRRIALDVAPALVATALLLWLQSAMTPKSYTPSILSAADYRITQPYVWLRYFAALFLPLHLNADSDLTAFSTVNLQVFTGFIFLALLIAAIVWTARRRDWAPVAFGLLWFVITEIPTSAYALSEVENDHRMFFAFVGLMLAAVWTLRMAAVRLLHADASPLLRRAAAIAAVLVLCAYAWGTHLRNRVWHDEESLWKDDVLKSPHNGRGLMNYGLTLMGRGDYTGALTQFERALDYTPNYFSLEINLAIATSVVQPANPAAAERHFQRAIALAPGSDESYSFYARWLLTQGRTDDAITNLKQAIALNPPRLMQRDLLINAYMQAGDAASARAAAAETLAIAPDDAVARAGLSASATRTADSYINESLGHYQRAEYPQAIEAARHALTLDPKSAAAWNNIGAAQAQLGDYASAVDSERKAVSLDPHLQIAQNNLAAYITALKNPATVAPKQPADFINLSLALNRQGKYAESIAAARQALKLAPRSAEAWNNIAADYESLHQWDPAIDAAQHALALRPDFQLAKNNLAWSQSQKAAAAK